MGEYSKEGTLSEIGFNVVREKVFKMLLDSAKITEVGGGAEAEKEKPVKEKKEKKK